MRIAALLIALIVACHHSAFAGDVAAAQSVTEFRRVLFRSA